MHPGLLGSAVLFSYFLDCLICVGRVLAKTKRTNRLSSTVGLSIHKFSSSVIHSRPVLGQLRYVLSVIQMVHTFSENSTLLEKMKLWLLLRPNHVIIQLASYVDPLVVVFSQHIGFVFLFCRAIATF